jgi:tRNA-specific 2-thiouridylase
VLVRVAVGLSGGIDSAAAALVLLEAGHDVFALTMRVPGRAGRAMEKGAARVAAALGIEHRGIDLTTEFESTVVEPFARAYASGSTPNPCVLCNRSIKFGALLDAALAGGADALATGHYARLEIPVDGPARLLEAADPAKDQTYFLAAVSGHALRSCIFPVGDLLKRDATLRVAEAGLAGLVSPESRDICFIPDGDMRGFLEARAPEALRSGPIEDIEGRVLGRHAGLGLYTVGQRTGLGLSRPRPTYVLAIDACRNALVVGDEEELEARGLEADELHWVSGSRPEPGLPLRVRVRLGAPTVAAGVAFDDRSACVRFERSVRAVAPGQAVVFSSGPEVLGSGTIRRGLR